MTISFIDSFTQTIDPKGRIVLPTVYREHFAAGAVISLRKDHLAIYPTEDWKRFLERLRDQRDTIDEHGRTRIPQGVVGEITRNSTEVKPDSQGRMLLKPALREALGLKNKVLICGGDTYVSVFDNETPREVDFSVYDFLERVGL